MHTHHAKCMACRAGNHSACYERDCSPCPPPPPRGSAPPSAPHARASCARSPSPTNACEAHTRRGQDERQQHRLASEGVERGGGAHRASSVGVRLMCRVTTTGPAQRAKWIDVHALDICRFCDTSP